MKKIISILLIVCILSFNIVFANNGTMDYRELVEQVIISTGFNLETPRPQFTITASDGQQANVYNDIEKPMPGESGSYEWNNPMTHRSQVDTMLNNNGEPFIVERGTRIDLDASLSTPGSGSSIVGYDWQIYRDMDNTAQYAYSRTTSFVADEGDEYYIFLNVKDNWNGHDYFSNWSELGNWRTNWSRESDVPGVRLEGWYFTVAKILVVDEMPPLAEFEIHYEGTDYTDNEDNPVIVDGYPITIDLVDKSTSEESEIVAWNWQVWRNNQWETFSEEQNPSLSIHWNIVGIRLQVTDANGLTSEVVNHTFYSNTEDTGDPPDEPDPPDTGVEGNVEITFSPNSTEEIGGNTVDNNSYWVNQDIDVTVTATGELEVTHNESRDYEFTYEWEEEIPVPPEEPGQPPGTDTITHTENGTGSQEWAFKQTFTPSRLEIGGTAGVSTTINNGGNVTITQEGMNMILNAEVAEWDKSSPEWEDGEPSATAPRGEITSVNWSSGEPSDAPEPTDTFSTDSGYYSLDKTSPKIYVDYSPIKDKWSNSNFRLTIRADDQSGQGASNVSGFINSMYDIENISYTGNHSFMGRRDIPHNHSSSFTYNDSITINEDGVYEIPISIEDLAGNQGEIYINGSRRSTNGSWTEGDLPLDKTDPEPAKFSVFDNGFSYPKSISGVEPKSSNVVNGEAPGFEYTVDRNNNSMIVTIDDNLSGTGDDATYDSDTNESRLQFAWSKSYEELTEGGWINYNSVYTSSRDILDEHINPTWTKPSYSSGNLGRTEIRFEPHINLEFYGQLLEGQWYLHIKQEDRAGNVTTTVSPPIHFNKIKNLRMVSNGDYRWGDIFKYGNGKPKDVAITGIRVKDAPIYRNRNGHTINLGYRITYKFDTVGFEEPNDEIHIKVGYHALDNTRTLYRDIDIYIPNGDGDYVRIDDINNPKFDDQLEYYYNRAKHIILKANSDNRQEYEDFNELDSIQRERHTKDLSKGKYNTYEDFIFLPPNAKFVRKGYPLDLFTEENMFDYELLVSFDIVGKKGHNRLADLDYTGKEDQWAVINKWHGKNTDDYNVYGKNKPTGIDLIGKGIDKGGFFYFDLGRTVIDDIELNREW